MSERQRWRNVKGRASRVTAPRERLVVGAVDLASRLLAPFLGTRATPGRPIREVLVLRLDRIGDVLMSLPALHALRQALPEARIRLAVGEWSREVAEDAPVDEVLVWNAPWAGRPDEGASTLPEIFARARALRSLPLDLAIDLQGDVRAVWLMAMTGAKRRAGYANTGSSALLTDIVDLDEDLNFVEQNRRAIDTALGARSPRSPFRWLSPERRRAGREALEARLVAAGRPRTQAPVIGIHPGAGRAIKEWPVDRYAELARRLSEEFGATLLLTGSASEANLTARIREAAPSACLDLAGELNLGALAEHMSACDAFVSGDTSALHFACALDVPSVSIFGPSDPGRYFSGGVDGFGGEKPHLVVAADLWCRPCNLIRRPPAECSRRPAPECLEGITVEAVMSACRALMSRA